MATTFKDTTWDQLQQIRAGLEAELSNSASLVTAAQQFTSAIASIFSTVALSRMFFVTPLGALPHAEQAWATQFAADAGRTAPLAAKTPVLCLLGTSGVEWA